jgi:preprotein translocase subunit Sec61beta
MSCKRKKEAPLPASSAGLLRFFEDETQGVKVRPEIVLAASITLILVSIITNLLFK